MLFFVLSFLTTLILYLYFKKKYSYWEKRGIKGPKPIWFFGNSLDEIFKDPEKLEKDYITKYGPVFGTYKGVTPILNTSKPEHIKKILNDSNVFHSIGSFEFLDDYFSSSILLKNGERWVNGRKAQTHFFTSNKIKSLFSHFESSINNFLKNVEYIQNKEKTESIDFKVLASHMTIDVISKLLFSININSFREKKSTFVKNSFEIISLNKLNFFLSEILPVEIIHFFKINVFNVKMLNKVGDLFKKMVRQRDEKEESFNDLVELIKEQNKIKNLGLTENEIIGNSMIGYFAGVNFVADSISSVFYHLFNNPDIKEKFISEIEKEFSEGVDYEKLVDNAYIDAVINESLRLNVSTRIISRTAMADIEIEDIKIEKGIEVNTLTWVVMNSEENFPNPNKFDPSRFLDKSSSNPNVINGSTYLPFGDGPKSCIGKRFSLVFIKYFFAKFFMKYDIYQPDDYKKDLFTIKNLYVYNNFVIGIKKKD